MQACFLYFCWKKTPWRCSVSEIPTYLTALSKCCTKLCQIWEENASENPPLSGENSFSKEGSMGIVSGYNSKWIHWKEQRVKGQSEGRWRPDRLYLKPSSPLWILQSWGAESPSGPWHSWAYFLSDILMTSFMEISHFPVCPRERRRTLFLSKGYRQGNTSRRWCSAVYSKQGEHRRTEMNL